MFEKLLMGVVLVGVAVMLAAPFVSLVWWKRTNAEVGWRWGMSRIGILLTWCGLLLAAGVMVSARVRPFSMADPRPFGQWVLSGLVIAVLTLVTGIVGRGWVRGLLVASALGIMLFWMGMASTF